MPIVYITAPKPLLRGTNVANTKSIENVTERKAKKRALRTALKAKFTALTKEQKRRFRNGETKGLRKFIAESAGA
jgi:hypothetical protein